jgi:hypothetical protein
LMLLLSSGLSFAIVPPPPAVNGHDKGPLSSEQTMIKVRQLAQDEGTELSAATSSSLALLYAKIDAVMKAKDRDRDQLTTEAAQHFENYLTQLDSEKFDDRIKLRIFLGTLFLNQHTESDPETYFNILSRLLPVTEDRDAQKKNELLLLAAAGPARRISKALKIAPFGLVASSLVAALIHAALFAPDNVSFSQSLSASAPALTLSAASAAVLIYIGILFRKKFLKPMVEVRYEQLQNRFMKEAAMTPRLQQAIQDCKAVFAME